MEMRFRPAHFAKYAATLVVLAMGLGTCVAQTAVYAAKAKQPWLDASLPINQRVDLLLSQMSLKEKLAMVEGSPTDIYSGYIPAIPRLEIPALHLQDGDAGVRMDGTTALPVPLAMAATWDRKMAALYGAVLARDSRAMGVNVILGPMVNLDRTAQAGRNFESLGEDPYLASRMVAPEVKAIEAGHVIATTKHYALNNQENGRLRDSSNIDLRTFHEMYLPAFAAAVHAGAGAIMCSYNRINGIWACQNSAFLNILKHTVGFSGFVMSDWGATHSTVASDHAGLDMEMPGDGGYYGSALAKAVVDGQVSQQRLNDQVRRILRAMFEAKLFEYPPQPHPIPAHLDRKAAEEVAEQGAVLLRNQHHLLPLHPEKLHSVALIGADINEDIHGGSAWVHGMDRVDPSRVIRFYLGNAVKVRYVYAEAVPFVSELPTVDSLSLSSSLGSGRVPGAVATYYSNGSFRGEPTITRHEPSIWANWQFADPRGIRSSNYSVRWTATFTPPATGSYTLGVESRGGERMYFNGREVLNDWKSSYSIKTDTFHAQLLAHHTYQVVVEVHGNVGSYQLCRMVWLPPAGAQTPDIAKAVKAARKSDVAIVFAGEFQTEQYDRPTIALEGLQVELIRAVAKANPRTIVILNNGGPIAAGDWANRVDSILDMWYPGEVNGDALAALLFGKVNPSGRLPVTFPRSPKETPAHVLWAAQPYSGPQRKLDYTEKLDVGYRWYDAHRIKPLFPFGYGLSYTTFRYSGLHVRRARGAKCGFRAGLDVTNTGKVAGADVVEVYLSYPKSAGEPERILRGFTRIALSPGQSKHVEVSLAGRSFSVWSDKNADWQRVPGKYLVSVGGSSENLPLKARIEVRSADSCNASHH